jgi:hypothetical protein
MFQWMLKYIAKRGGWKLVTALTMLGCFLVTERSAYAYLDPGSGSMLIQMLVAAVAGVLLSARLFWNRLKVGVLSLFSRGNAESDSDPE